MKSIFLCVFLSAPILATRWAPRQVEPCPRALAKDGHCVGHTSTRASDSSSGLSRGFVGSHLVPYERALDSSSAHAAIVKGKTDELYPKILRRTKTSTRIRDRKQAQDSSPSEASKSRQEESKLGKKPDQPKQKPNHPTDHETVDSALEKQARVETQRKRDRERAERRKATETEEQKQARRKTQAANSRRSYEKRLANETEAQREERRERLRKYNKARYERIKENRHDQQEQAS